MFNQQKKEYIMTNEQKLIATRKAIMASTFFADCGFTKPMKTKKYGTFPAEWKLRYGKENPFENKGKYDNLMILVEAKYTLGRGAIRRLEEITKECGTTYLITTTDAWSTCWLMGWKAVKKGQLLINIY